MLACLKAWRADVRFPSPLVYSLSLWRLWAVLLALAAALPLNAAAQVPDTTAAPPDSVQEALPPPFSPSDTLGTAPTSARPEAAAPVPEGGLKEPIEFTGDSLTIDFDEENGDEGSLVSQAVVTYGASKLDAYKVDMIFEIDELRASGLPSDTGMVGRPRFQEGAGETFLGNELAYNMGTERGRVVVAQTQIDDGFVNAEVVKTLADSTQFMRNGSYTTCDCPPGETPSYSLRASKMKQAADWIYTGPIQLFIFNIPTPLWLPFGFLPATEGRRSGPLPPDYGEDHLGFFLRNWGWYWAVSDYFDLQVQAGIWSKGSWEIRPRTRYTKRYRYNGALSVSYVRNRQGERGDPARDRQSQNSARIQWQHSQTISPTFSLNGSVNLASTSYLRTVSENYDDRVAQTIQSNISLRKNWPGAGRSLSLNASQQQQLSTGEVNLTLPSLNFSQSARKPFERDVRPAGSRERFYEKITYSYTGQVDNRYRFDPLSVDTLVARGDSAAAEIDWYEALASPEKYRRATGETVPFDFSASHRIPISASFSVRRLPIINKTFILNVSPSFNYNEEWFISTDRRPDVDTSATTSSRLQTEQVPGFFALRQFSSSLSANTTFYGIFPVGIGPYQGVRHTVRPSLSFTYRPDFYGDFWGYTRTYRNARGELEEYGIVSGVQRGRQQAVSLSFSNVFETKRVERDSTGEEQSKTLKLLNADLRTSYNFAADSLKLSDISLSARTSILGEVDVQFNSSFSPYRQDLATGRTLNQYVFNPRRLSLARLERLSLNVSTDLRGGGSSAGGRPYEGRPAGSFGPGDPTFTDPALTPPGIDPLDPTDPFALDDYASDYADFDIPWSLNLRFSYAYAPATSARSRTNRSATLNTRFDFGLTPNWQLSGNTGYDFVQWEFATTQLRILRDFECWQMSISWTPFGRYQSYSFDLHVKSGKLSELLRLRQPRSGIRDRFGSAFDR